MKLVKIDSVIIMKLFIFFVSESELELRKRLQQEIEDKEQRLKELQQQAMIHKQNTNNQQQNVFRKQTPQQMAASKRKAQMESLPMKKNSDGLFYLPV